MSNKRKRSNIKSKKTKKTQKNKFKKTKQQVINKLIKLNLSSEYKQDDDIYKQLDAYKVFVFDLDNTLYLHNVNSFYSDRYHKDVKTFLEKLKTKNKILCIATHNKNPKYYLDKIEISDLFDHIIYEKKDVNPYCNSIHEYTGKDEMIQEIIDKTKCKKEEIIFYDDADYNIKKVENFGIKSIKIDDNIGIVFNSPILTF
jgi:HAD superfamily phosphatase (TIGR01681 family)